MDYKELKIWQTARELASDMYKRTKEFPEDEKFGLKTQIRRSAVSIVANIAEACGRRSNKDIIRLLYISRGSLYELESHCYFALDLNIIHLQEFEETSNQIGQCKRLLNGFINYFKSRMHKGYSES